jgi:uncharacterized repeat protein (TIGR01451 family)
MKKIIILLFLAIICCHANSQTISFNILTPPCNGTLGTLQIHTTGMTLPIVFNIWSSPLSIIDTVNSPDDTVLNYAGNPLEVSYYNPMAAYAFYATFAGHHPFTDSLYITPAICPALGTATEIVAGGLAPYTVQWYDNTGTVLLGTGSSISLPGGYYSVKITDANGCIDGPLIDSVNIPEQSTIAYSVTTTTASCTNGTATASLPTGGVAPYTYLWNTGATTPSISGLITGYYSLTVTDALGCYQNDPYIFINQVPFISDSIVTTPATCIGSNGSAIAFGHGGVSPYTYLWNTGATTQSITGLAPGYYNVIATDANGCISGYGGNSVGSSTPITVTYSYSPSSCTASTGADTLHISGGTPPYTITWNTFPVQTGPVAINLAPGFYNFHIVDAVGCVQSGTAQVAAISSLFPTISSTPAMCLLPNGTASISVWGTAPPFTYLWSTSATTSAISGLVAGGYTCTITDNNGCSVTKHTYVSASSTISLGISTTLASCIFVSDGTATVYPTGGTAPYTYYWSSGATTPTATALATGWYWVTVHDATGCTASQWVFVDYNHAVTSCYCTIAGIVYDDINGNCIQDAGEPGVQNIMMHLSGRGYTYTDAVGNYSFIVPSGTYTLNENIGAYYPLASCQSNYIPVTVVAAAGCVITENFANVINPLHDVSIYTTSCPAVPGNNCSQHIIVKNNGTITEPAIQLGYSHDGQLSYNTVSPNLFTQLAPIPDPDWYSIVTGFPTLTPGTTQSFTVQYNVPTNIPIGTIVNFNDSAVSASPMSSWLADYTPWNNVCAYTTYVAASYDPNNKSVTPQGSGTAGYITQNDSVLTYTIHFQNTGTYPAQNIVLIDTLSDNLNLATLTPVYSNHAFTTTVSETGVIKFSFDNIYLPYYGDASNAEIVYTVHLKPNLADYTQIKNTANIFFDYNAPITTNTTLNTISHYAGINETVAHDEVLIYPNPATSAFTVSSSSKIENIKVFNLLGEEIISNNPNNNQATININQYSSGIYFVQIKTEKGIVMRKIVKE